MFAQLWHTGRSSHVSMTGGSAAGFRLRHAGILEHPTTWSPSPVGWVQPSPHRSLTAAGIAALVDDYRRAAERAMDAGFDGVELHGCERLPGRPVPSGRQQSAHRRLRRFHSRTVTRFLIEIVDALVAVGGPGRVAVRIGPGGTWNAMSDSDPHRLFTFVASRLNGFDLAYLHLIEPRVSGSQVVHEVKAPKPPSACATSSRAA